MDKARYVIALLLLLALPMMVEGQEPTDNGTVPPYVVWLPVVEDNMLPETGCFAVGLSPEDGVTVDLETLEFRVYMVASKCGPSERYAIPYVYMREKGTQAYLAGGEKWPVISLSKTPYVGKLTLSDFSVMGSPPTLESGKWYEWNAGMATFTDSPSGGLYPTGSYPEENWRSFYVP